MRIKRKHCTADEKIVILRRHLLNKAPVFDLCEEPDSFYYLCSALAPQPPN